MINMNNAERIMADYMPLIYATVRRFDKFDRAEAIDEAKMVLMEAILDYDESKGSFGNYLKNMLNYYFWDKAKKPIPISLDIESGNGASIKDDLVCDDDIEDDFFTKEKYKDLYGMIKSLDDKDILIIKLKYWENLSDKKIGEVMSLSAKTIRNRHSLALKDLKEMMEVE